MSKSCPLTPPGHIRGISDSCHESISPKAKVHFSETVEVHFIEPESAMIQKLKVDNDERNEEKQAKGYNVDSSEKKADFGSELKRYKSDLYIKPCGGVAAYHHLPFPDCSELKYEPFSHKLSVPDIFSKRSREEDFSEFEDDNLHSKAKRPNTNPELPVMQEKSAVAAFPLNLSSLGKRNRDELSQNQNLDASEEARIEEMIKARRSGIEPSGEWDNVDELCDAFSSASIDPNPHPTFTQSLGDTFG